MAGVDELDELRAKLRALGYLQAGVDRFVLGPARGTRSVGAIALGSSARIGLLAGALLGPAAASGIGFRLPGLITGPRDAVVVALYLGALFGVAAATCAFGVAALAAFMFRRTAARRGVPQRIRYITTAAGVLVSLASLVYLTLWWRTTDASSVWTEPLRTVLALAVSVGISLLLGHTVRVTALAVIARSSGSLDLEPHRAQGAWKTSTAAGLAAFLGAALLLVSTAGWHAGTRAADQAAPTFSVRPTGLRVRLVAIDGFDPGLYDQLAAEKRLPALQAMLAGGSARLAARATRDPVRVWTTIATGQPAEIHGLESLAMRRVAGIQGRVTGQDSPLGTTVAAATDLLRLTRPAVASGAQRRAKAFWEIAAETGFRVAIINWWATWPALGTDAIIITDRAPLRLERGGALNAEVAPAALYQDLKRDWPAISAAARQRARSAFASGHPFVDILRRSAELDAVQLELVRRPVIGTPDLLAVYLPGLDMAQHALLGEEGSPRATSPSDLADRLDALRSYYGFLDGALQPVLDGNSPEVARLLLTHPGRLGGGEALLSVRGAAARLQAEGVRGEIVDVAPTVLFLLGLPISRELPGTARLDLIAADFAARFPISTIATYGPPRLRPAPGDPRLDDEMMERLRSLGYVR